MCMETTLVIIGFRSFLLLRRGDFFSTEVIHMNFSFQLTFLFLDFVVMDTIVQELTQVVKRVPKDADFRLRFLGTTVGSTTAIKSAYKTGISIGKKEGISSRIYMV